mmetsp:Transcript_6757/g.25260  ORF Transcript_6757/g.25260 Transcript_6757/m.25260 type:complete len:938 (-) Transcript_6757:4524-7337(-)
MAPPQNRTLKKKASGTVDASFGSNGATQQGINASTTGKSPQQPPSHPLHHLLHTDPKSLNELYLSYCTDTRVKHITKQHRKWFERELVRGERESLREWWGRWHLGRLQRVDSLVATDQQTTKNGATTVEGTAVAGEHDPTLPSSIAHIVLRSARASKQTAISLSKILAKPEYSSCVQVLDLHENVIRDDGCVALVHNWLKGPHLRGTSVLASASTTSASTNRSVAASSVHPQQIVTKLDLGSNDISPKGLVPLIEYLMDTSLSGHLRELILGSEPGDLYANKMDTKTACMLAKALEINHAIQVLNLNRNTGIGKRSQKAFKRLALAFQKNEALQELRLGEVDMSTQSAIGILLALANHENLQVLDLHGNGLTHEITKPLRRVIVPHKYEHAHHQDAQREESAAEHIASLEKNMGSGGNSSLVESPTKGDGLFSHHHSMYSGGDMQISSSANPFESDDSDQDSEHDEDLFAGDNVQESKLSILLLNGNHIGPKGMRILFPALKKNNSLTILNLASNGIANEGAEYIAEFLQSNRSLERLDLQDNHISESGTIAIASALSSNCNLRDLNMSKNKCGDQGVAALGLILKDNKTLQHLNISLSACGDAGALAIFQSLAVNRTIIHINMSSNHLSEDSGVALEQALRKASQLMKAKRQKGALKSIILTGNQIDHTTLSRVKKIIWKSKIQRQQHRPIALQRELIRLQYISQLLNKAREDHDRFFTERRRLEAELATVRDHQQEMVLKIDMATQEQHANIEIEQNTIDDNAHKMKIKAAEAKKTEDKFEQKIADFESIIHKQQEKRKVLQEKLNTLNKEHEAYAEHPDERKEELTARVETMKSELEAGEKQKESQGKDIEKMQSELSVIMGKMNEKQIAAIEDNLQKEEKKQKEAEAAAEEEKKKEEESKRSSPPSLMEQVRVRETTEDVDSGITGVTDEKVG